MTKEEILQLTKGHCVIESGMPGTVDFYFSEYGIQTFANTCYNKGLERAAEICDKQATEPECPERAGYCAAAIRKELK